MKSLFLVCLTVVAYVRCTEPPVSLELHAVMAKIHNMVEGLFTTADVNQDGHFGADDVEAIFEQCDINHDSAVSKSEFERCFSEDAPDMMMVADGFFLDLDMDKNGVLEQGDTQLYYDKIDQNDDGTVNKAEFVNYFQQLFEVLFILTIKNEEALMSTTPSA